MIHERTKSIINNYFTKLGLANRVDPITMVPQRHVRRVRLRSDISKAAEDNKLWQIANIELINARLG
ncbi:conjugal transfer protein TraA [Orientia tsutsugamushi]|nr:conjugal transfer protein TraA [Orientia tsutsugamushi]